jgi:hypothetical protein
MAQKYYKVSKVSEDDTREYVDEFVENVRDSFMSLPTEKRILSSSSLCDKFISHLCCQERDDGRKQLRVIDAKLIPVLHKELMDNGFPHLINTWKIGGSNNAISRLNCYKGPCKWKKFIYSSYLNRRFIDVLLSKIISLLQIMLFFF